MKKKHPSLPAGGGGGGEGGERAICKGRGARGLSLKKQDPEPSKFQLRNGLLKPQNLQWVMFLRIPDHMVSHTKGLAKKGSEPV